MRVLALVSGGKDSCFNMMQCVAAGHEIVALANLQPAKLDEIDSYMYQTVGHDGISLYSEALDLPLYRRTIQGNTVASGLDYLPTDGDEVEDLYILLSEIKEQIQFDAVSVGAILSDYQRIRVENVCVRLGCVCLAYLWRRSQTELLQEMIDCGINAIIIKTACLGLDPDSHLGQTISEMQAHLLGCKEKYGINVCGEGGEYETFTLDCALFKKSIILEEYEKVIHSNDAFAPVGYMKLSKMRLENKTAPEILKTNEISETSPISTSAIQSQKDLLNGLPVRTPLDFLTDIAECKVAECCDGRDEICSKHLKEESAESNNAFSSNSSNCSGGEVERELVTQMFLPTSVDLEEILPSDPMQTSTSTLSNLNGETNNESNHENVVTVNTVDESCRMKDIKETQICEVTVRTIKNEKGWCWITGLCGRLKAGESPSEEDPMGMALLALKRTLEVEGLELSDLVAITMYLDDMNNYSKYNKEYIKVFAHRPPVRVCVAAPLPQDMPIVLEVLAFRASKTELSDDDTTFTKSCMHVQGISHWAPANIGPYSQAVWVGEVLYVAGQIGLIPGSMKLIEGGTRMECKLALRHLNRIMKATDLKVELRDVVQSICYVTDPAYIVQCREEWEKRTNNAIVEYLVVKQLPRDAKVEWQVWAHKHNAAFEYEETGCYIGSGIKVKLTRRSSYESRVAAIVCRASIRDHTGKFGVDEIGQIADYSLNKLVQEAAVTEKPLECSLRVFYHTGVIHPANIYEALESRLPKHSVAYSIVPVCSLKDNTALSFCGVRHQ